MKAVLMSIQPKWCELIASGKKTVEARKTRPRMETPFKVYIYCTKGETVYHPRDIFGNEALNGKVIGEFVCDNIDDFYCASIPYRKTNNLGYGYFVDNGVYKVDGWHEGVVFERSGPRIDTMLKNTDLENMCLSAQEIFDYIGIGKHLYGWHISNLVIYDKPRELHSFFKPRTVEEIEADVAVAILTCGIHESPFAIKKPPQSWCYVEESKRWITN